MRWFPTTQGPLEEGAGTRGALCTGGRLAAILYALKQLPHRCLCVFRASVVEERALWHLGLTAGTSSGCWRERPGGSQSSVCSSS